MAAINFTDTFRWPKRYWRGELPLHVTFFGGWIFVFCFTYIFHLLADVFFKSSYNLLLAPLVLSVAYIGSTLALVWWGVGLWKSASKHKRGYYWQVAVFLSKLIVCIAAGKELYLYGVVVKPQLEDVFAEIAGDPQWGEGEVRVDQARGQLEVYGSITQSLANAVDEALVSASHVKVVRLESPGGRVGAALRIRNSIRSRSLDTFVQKECNSVCSIAFMGGMHRSISPEAKIGFHSARFGGERAMAANSLMKAQLAADGVSIPFLEKALSVSPDSMWYPSVEELIHSGVVTNVLSDTVLD